MNSSTASRCFRRLTVAALFVAGGCAVHQRDEVSVYRQVIDGDQPANVHPNIPSTHPTTTTAPSGSFLTLTDALRLANQNEEQLSIQGETYLQSLIAIDSVYARFQPNVSLSGGDTESSSHANPFRQATNNGSVSAGGDINLFNGYRDYYALLAARATADQDKMLILDLQQTVLLDVVSAYYQVLTSEQSVQVFANSIQVQKQQVDLMEAQRNVGISRPLDIAQAQAQLSQTEVSLYEAQADVQNARITLAFLLDARVDNRPLLDDFEPPDAIQSVEGWMSLAERVRQDLLADNNAVVAARDNVEVAFGEYYPSISFNVNALVLQSVNPMSGPWSAALSMTAPLFTGGSIQADVRTAWSRFRQAALQQAELRRTIVETIGNDYVNLELARREIPELKIQLKAASDALDVAIAQYRYGNGTYLNIETAQQTLLSTQLQLTTEQFTQKTAYFTLLRAAGQLQMSVPHSATRPEEEQLRELTTRPTTLPAGKLPLPPPPTQPATIPATLPMLESTTQPAME